MKKTLSTYIIDIGLLFIISVISALILTTLRITNQIDNDTYELVIMIVSSITFFIGGLFLGIKMEKRGLLNGIILALIYTTFALLFNFLGLEKGIELTKIFELALNNTLLIVGCLLGVNLTNR